ncbi:hypothetical protein [Streptomyces sp. NPDC001123]
MAADLVGTDEAVGVSLELEAAAAHRQIMTGCTTGRIVLVP